MANTVIRIILGIVLGIAAIIGIYFILPGNIKHPLQEKLQSWLKADQYEAVTYMKSLKVPDEDNMTFGDMIEYAGKHGSWIIEEADVGEDGKSGSYLISAFTYDVDLNMAQENGQENRKNITQTSVQISFTVKRTVGQTPEYVISTYNVVVEDTVQNAFYKKEALRSLCSSARKNKVVAPAAE
ncbi:MAG: hypothetical protein IKN79_03540 [Eubacterium sp.]|nr:hypothetical protein [Eubacterium sp.]